MWSVNHQLLEEGEEIYIDESERVTNAAGDVIQIFLLRSFRSGLWKTICNGVICPGDTRHRKKVCSYRGECNFGRCPYGLISFHKKR